MIKWRFPSNDHGENKGINDSGVATFRGTPLKSLAREICQNSLDAAREDTIKIEFDMFDIPTEQIPGKKALQDTFQRCLDFWKPQKERRTKDFYDNAIDVINKDKCYILRISDYKTIGLTGTKEEINTHWTNLTKSSGASDKKGTAGGSYGIGKYATFACSDFSTVFYSTYNQDEEEAYQGVSRLVTFRREDDETTQGIGYYGNEKNKPVPDQLQLQPGYSRDSGDYGTDIYIVGYNHVSKDWKKDIIISILDGFLGAIWNGKLEVNVGEVRITRNTLAELIEEYRAELTGYTDKYYQVLISKDTDWYEEDFMGLGNVKLGILLGDQDAPKRVAMIRQTGMKIMDKDRLPGLVPFVGVMFIEGNKINERLRSIENPEHTEWQPERAKNSFQEKVLIKAINKFIRDRIDKLISMGNKDEMDAIGVGTFLPDDNLDSGEQAIEEVVSDKVVEVEKNIIKKKTISGQEPGNSLMDNDKITSGHKEADGDEEEWFHTDGKTKDRKPKDGQPAHTENGGKDGGISKVAVSLKKFLPVCVDKNKGNYVFMVVPNEDGADATLEVYLSAETQMYEANIKSASVIGDKKLTVDGNKIKGLKFRKDQAIRIRVDLDYYDLCAMEVKSYAVKK